MAGQSMISREVTLLARNIPHPEPLSSLEETMTLLPQATWTLHLSPCWDSQNRSVVSQRAVVKQDCNF